MIDYILSRKDLIPSLEMCGKHNLLLHLVGKVGRLGKNISKCRKTNILKNTIYDLGDEKQWPQSSRALVSGFKSIHQIETLKVSHPEQNFFNL